MSLPEVIFEHDGTQFFADPPTTTVTTVGQVRVGDLVRGVPPWAKSGAEHAWMRVASIEQPWPPMIGLCAHPTSERDEQIRWVGKPDAEITIYRIDGSATEGRER